MIQKKPPEGGVICPECHARNFSQDKTCTACAEVLPEWEFDQTSAHTGSTGSLVVCGTSPSLSADGNFTPSGNTSSRGPSGSDGISPSTTSVTDGTRSSSDNSSESPSATKALNRNNDIHAEVTDERKETTFGSNKSNSHSKETLDCLMETDEFPNDETMAGSATVTTDNNVPRKFDTPIGQSDLAKKGYDLPYQSHIYPPLPEPNELLYGDLPTKSVDDDKLPTQKSSPESSSPQKILPFEGDDAMDTTPDHSLSAERSPQLLNEQSDQSQKTQNNLTASVVAESFNARSTENASDNVVHQQLFGKSANLKVEPSPRPDPSWAQVTARGTLTDRQQQQSNNVVDPVTFSANSASANKKPDLNLSKKDVITFQFIIVVPPHVALNKDADALFVVFGHHSLGGWDDPKPQFKLRFISSFTSDVNSDYHIYSQTAEIDRNLVTKGRKLDYKYIILKSNHKYHWEILHGENNKYTANRTLKVSVDRAQLIVRFDGCFEPDFKDENRGFIQGIKTFFGGHEVNVFPIVHNDHKLAMHYLLPTFDKDQGFMVYDYDGDQPAKRHVAADIAIRQIRKIAIDFKGNSAAFENDCLEVLANYFTGILHTADLVSNDPIIRFAGVLTFIRCISLLEGRQVGLAEPILKKIRNNPKNLLREVCRLLALTPNIDRKDLFNLAFSINNVKSENFRTKELPEAVLQYMDRVGQQALCSVPFYHLIMEIPNYWSVSNYKCTDDAWWGSASLVSYLLPNRTVQSDALKEIFYQILSWLTETETPAFLQTILCVYCDEPQRVIELELARHDPILLVAWIAFQWRQPKYPKHASNLEKFIDGYNLLFDHIIYALRRDSKVKYYKEQLHVYPEILRILFEVLEDNIDFLRHGGRYLSPYLVCNIASMLDASAFLLHQYYGEQFGLQKLMGLSESLLKKMFKRLFPLSDPLQNEIQIMIYFGKTKMEVMGELWLSLVCNLFRERSQLYLKKMDAAQILEWYCECNQENVADEFRKVLGTFIENLIENNGEHLLNKKNRAAIRPEAKEGLRRAVTNIFEKQWPKESSDSAVVAHMLNWPLMDSVISRRRESDFDLLFPEAFEKLNVGLSLVASSWEACITGDISLKSAAELWAKKDRFVLLISKIYNTILYETINSTLEQLQNVGHKFTSLMKNLKALKFLLKSEETQISYLDAPTSQKVDYILTTGAELIISYFASKSASKTGEWQFKSPLPLELERMLTMIRDRKLSTSELFNAFLKENLKGRSLMSFDTLASLIIKPTIAQLKETVRIILNGQIPLKDVVKLVNILPPDHIHSNSFQTELLLLCNEMKIGNTNTVKLRVTQMLRFLDIRRKSFDCTILNKLLQELKLDNCQEEISLFVEMSANLKEKTLGEITDDLTHIASTVQTITGKRGDCLKTLLNNWEFIEWIRKVAGKTERDLQNFVSIASTNVGESEIEIAMMSDFGKAVTGFSSLIYGIYEIANKESLTLTEFFDDFLEPIWQALERDPKLPAKLAQSAKNTDRIKCLNEATGSLEKHSITKAREINKFGVFTVGCLDKSRIFVNPDDCVRMMLKKDIWSMRELRDLRSKLMLIGVQMDAQDQSRQEIDSFTKLFDAVAGLASLYTGHCKAGNVLLSQLHCTFNCDPRVSYQLMAKLQDQPPGFESKCTEQVNLIDQIGGISTFLEESLKSWKAHLSKTRQEFPELNYFTSQQLVYLRHQVVQVKKEQCLNPATALQLMSLQPNVNAKMVLSAMDKSVTDMGNEDNSDSCMEQPKEELRYFVEQLIEMGVQDEDIALRAITAKGTEDLELALEWALNYMDDETEKDQMIKEVPSFNEKLSQLTEQLELCSETESLAVQLRRIWVKYLEVHETRYKELMGLRQLGYLLRHLTSPTVLPCVPCPAIIKPNVPNLAILPETDIPRYVLSLFAQSDYKGLTYENVFVCSERTTAEELHLFLLRIQKPIGRAVGSRLFSVVCIDRLTSEVCQAVEVNLNQDLRNAKSFGLVLICAEETSDRCHLAGVLSRYQLKVKEAMLKISKTRCCVQKLLQRQELTGSLDSLLLPHYYSGYLCTSIGYGHGKSDAICKQQQCLPPETKVFKIPVHSRSLDLDIMFSSLKKEGLVDPSKSPKRLIHLDILDHRVRQVDMFLFQLLILGGFVDSSGNVWRKLPNDCYAIEITSVANELCPTDLPANEFRFLLPVIQCHSPAMTKHYSDHPDLIKQKCYPHIFHRLLDVQFLRDERVQRCCAYLQRQNEDLTKFLFVPDPRQISDNSLDILLENCGVKNPSWTELSHFIKFLNRQLLFCENSSYFSHQVARDLPGIKTFVVKFLIQMSKDFATRSLVISEDVSQLTKGQEAFEELAQYGLKQRWERTPHPYLFFNADAQTFSFFGCNFRCSQNSVDLTDSSEEKIIHKGIVTRLLYDALLTQTRNDRFANDFELSFERKNQQEKLLKLCRVLGLPDPRMPSDKPDAVGPFTENPDPNYEITTDCALKMLAIEMRFRCDIPVVIMGETGCGKTRLIRYLCDLKKSGKNVQNLIILRVHGGITADKIRAVVTNAIEVSKTNWRLHEVKTCLFFDEANTTTAISQIKEIVCDHTMDGEKLQLASLDIIAAVNPYRRHSDEVIQKLEGAGLGYHVQDINSVEKFGDIPMRRLVYRVQPLPPSMIPFVWDFGQLTIEAERIYITQMVEKFVSRVFGNGNAIDILKRVMIDVLTKTQQFMQKEQNESAFVSLRDVERTITVMEWFWRHEKLLFREMNEKMDETSEDVNPITRSLVLALSVCYRPSLQKKRGDFDKLITSCLQDQYALTDSATVAKELAACQAVFIDNVELEDNIAKNEALKENLFMMVMCIELRIPLFLVGKPGTQNRWLKPLLTLLCKELIHHILFSNC